MEHNVGNDRQHVFIQVHVLLLIYVTPAGCAQVMNRVFMLFQVEKKGSFLRCGPWALKTDRLMLDSSFRGKCQPHITLSYDSRGRGETSSLPESALRSTHITANVSLWAAHCHSFSVEYREGTSAEEDQRTEVEQHPSLPKSIQRGLTRKCQPRIKACVRIMPSLHLNNGQF